MTLPCSDGTGAAGVLDDVCGERVYLVDAHPEGWLRAHHPQAVPGAVIAWRDGVILNPHYKGMRDLYGSEYWPYLLPRRVGAAAARAITQGRLPVSAREAARPTNQ